jgi:hypothetical protein
MSQNRPTTIDMHEETARRAQVALLLEPPSLAVTSPQAAEKTPIVSIDARQKEVR